MRFRAILITGILLAALSGRPAKTGDCYARLGHSAQRFRTYFRALDRPEARLNALERVVFSLVLAGTPSSGPCVQSGS